MPGCWSTSRDAVRWWRGDFGIWRGCVTSPICSVRSPRPPNPVEGSASIDEAVLGRLRQARAVARERAWLARTEIGRVLPTTAAGRRVLPALVIDVDIDIDASLVPCHRRERIGCCHVQRPLRIPPAAGVPRQDQ